MVDFACKKFDLDEIIKCSLNLTKVEFKIMEHLIRNDKRWVTTLELSKRLKVGLSTVQKAVKKLKQSNVIKQGQKNLKKGGYVFIYYIKDKDILRKIVLNIVHSWTKRFGTEIEKW